MAARATTPPAQDGDAGNHHEGTTKGASEAKLAIENVLKHKEEDYESILGVSKSDDEETKRRAFERIAVLVHTKVTYNATNSDATTAYKSNYSRALNKTLLTKEC